MQRAHGDLFEISFLGEHQVNGVGFHLGLFEYGYVVHVNDLRFSGLAVLFLDIVELVGNVGLDLEFVAQQFFEMLDLLFEILDLRDLVENILSVEVTQLDVGNVFRLDLVDGKAFHQIGDNLLLLLGAADDADRLVNVQKDLAQRQKQVQLILFLTQLVRQLSTHANGAEADPFVEQIGNAQLSGRTVNEHVEVAAEFVFQGSQLE